MARPMARLSVSPSQHGWFAARGTHGRRWQPVVKPFVVSLPNHQRLDFGREPFPFDKIRTNGGLHHGSLLR